MTADTPPVVFVDIDDCIATSRAHYATGDWIDATAAGLLRRLCRDTGARIVIISTWRSDADRCRAAFDRHDLTDHLWSPVTVGSKRFVAGDTSDDWCVDWDNGDRSGTIVRWLANHPQVGRWIILDDSHSNLTPAQKKRWVQPDMQFGMSLNDLARARRLFGLVGHTVPDDQQTPRHTIANRARAALNALDQGDPYAAAALLQSIIGDPLSQ